MAVKGKYNILPEWFTGPPDPMTMKEWDFIEDSGAVKYRMRVRAPDKVKAVRTVQSIMGHMSDLQKWYLLNAPPSAELRHHDIGFEPQLVTTMKIHEVIPPESTDPH